MKELDGAERAFQEAIEKAPSFAEAYYNLGSLYLQTDRAEQAIPILRHALALKPDYTKARTKLDQALARTSNKR